MADSCIIPRPWGRPGVSRPASPTNRTGYFLGRALVKAAAARSAATAPGVDVGRLGKALCGFDDPFHVLREPVIPPFPPGDDGRVVLTVSNVNAVLDDGWDFKMNGVFVCNYDGGGATTASFSADLAPGLVIELTAECVSEQNDNLFSVTVTVDGVTVIDTEISGDGTVGEIQNLGTFNT